MTSERCWCVDPGCPAHKGESKCSKPATARLSRIDMDDEFGTPMCEECAVEAEEEGFLDDPDFDAEEEEEEGCPCFNCFNDDEKEEPS